MNRSEINRYINDARNFFEQHQFYLPPWSTYSPADWQNITVKSYEISDNMLGWDITDFGSGDFIKT